MKCWSWSFRRKERAPPQPDKTEPRWELLVPETMDKLADKSGVPYLPREILDKTIKEAEINYKMHGMHAVVDLIECRFDWWQYQVMTGAVEA